MRIASTIGATSAVHAGESYSPNEHGLFDVPEHVGRDLIGFPHWVEEHVAADRDRTDQTASDEDPAGMAARIAELETRAADLEARAEHAETDLADARAQIAELEEHVTAAGEALTEPDGDGVIPAADSDTDSAAGKRTRTRTRA